MKMKKKDKSKNEFPKTYDAIDSYQSVADPLGSYTGLTKDLHVMPRKTVDGKIFMKVDDLPIQDADDL